MQYGPFYPSSVSQSGDGTNWGNLTNATGAPDSNPATSLLIGESVTKVLRVTGFGANVPMDKTVSEVRFCVLPGIGSAFNPSSHQAVLPGNGTVETSQNGDVFRLEENSPDPLVVNDAAFGFEISIYGSSGGLVSVDTIALYVDAE